MKRYLLVVGMCLGCGRSTGVKISAPSEAREAEIIGTDDRLQYYQTSGVTDRQALDATAALVDEVVDNGNGTTSLDPREMEAGSQFLCAGQRLYNESYCGGQECTAFLIAPDILATADHCISDAADEGQDLANYAAVFGFRMSTATNEVQTFPSSDVYHVTGILARGYGGDPITNGSDWALLQLDRQVTGSRPILSPDYRNFSPSSNIYGSPWQGHVVISTVTPGYPGGFPEMLSTAGVAEVEDASTGEIQVQGLDISNGNSGGPAIEKYTRLVEGILSWNGGLGDWSNGSGCTKEAVYTSSQEDVNFNAILPVLPYTRPFGYYYATSGSNQVTPIGAPSVAVNGANVYAFARNSDDQIYYTARQIVSEDGDNSAWNQWGPVPGGLATDAQPFVFYKNGTGLIILAKNKSTNQVMIQTFSGSSWSGWWVLDAGITTIDGPTAFLMGSSSNPDFAVVVRDPSNTLDVDVFHANGQSSGWNGFWGPVYSPARGTSALNSGSYTGYIGIRDQTNAIVVLSMNPGDVTPSGGAYIPGNGATLSEPALLAYNGVMRIFVRGTDNRLYNQNVTIANWSGPGWSLATDDTGAGAGHTWAGSALYTSYSSGTQNLWVITSAADRHMYQYPYLSGW